MYRASGVGEGTPTEVVSKTCFIERYQRGPVLFLVYKEPRAKSEKLEGTVLPVVSSKKNGSDCLPGALRDIERLGLSNYRSVVSRARKRHQWRWEDPDIGPVKWLDCSDKASERYRHSYIALAHELVHGLTGPDCVWDPTKDKSICFRLDPLALPPAAVARSKIRFANRQTQLTVDHFQNLYLPVGGAASIVHILDELTAYGLSTEGLIRLVETKQIGTSLNLLPMFLFYTANYLRNLELRTPDKFAKYFGRGTTNRASVLSLTKRGEQLMEKWIKANRSVRRGGHPYGEAENSFFNDYKELKRECGLWSTVTDGT